MPSSADRADWMALALGALEPGDAAALLRAAGPGASLRLATMRTLAGLPPELGPTAPVAPLRAHLGAAPLLAARRDELTPTVELVALGARVRLAVLPPAPASRLRPLLLRIVGQRVDRLFPTSSERWPTLDIFDEEDGARVIDLVAGPPVGFQLLVLGLLSAEEVDEPWPPGDPRDARVREAVQAGRLPGVALTIQVI